MKKFIAGAFLTLTALTILTIAVLGFWMMINAAIHGDDTAQFVLRLIGVLIGAVIFAGAFFWSLDQFDNF